MTELGEQAQGWLDSLRATFTKRKGDYAWAEIAGGYSTTAASPMIAFMVIRMHSEGTPQKAWHGRYSHLSLFEQAVAPEAGWGIFENLVLERPVSIGGDVPHLGFCKPSLDEPRRLNSHRYPFSEDWPCDVGTLTNNNGGQVFHELLVSSDGPLYPGSQYALEEVTGLPMAWNGFRRTVYIVLPDRRCRVKGLQISSTSISGTIERGPVPSGRLALKVYATPFDQSARQHERERLGKYPVPHQFSLEEPNGPFEFHVDSFQFEVLAAVVEHGSNAVLDMKSYEFGRESLSGDVALEADESYLEAVIHEGESNQMEFKETPEGGDSWLRTVCAFSNGIGGSLIFGVKDDASIVGLKSPKGEDWYTQRIRDSIEPFPTCEFKTSTVGGAMIEYLTVEPGTEKPYCVRDHGVFVRIQATTRQANREELLRLTTKSNTIQT